MSRNESDVEARLRELEATVTGLTQELVDANERIRALEAAAEAADDPADDPGTPVQGAATEDRSTATDSQTDDGAARQMAEEVEPEGEAEDHELDDIIVA